MAEEKTFLCELPDIMQHKSKGFSINAGNRILHIFLVQLEGKLYGYINRCPHTGVTLDWVQDQFLDVSEKLIQCATHGAQFRIEDGFCVYGPCSGASLTPVSITVEQDKVYLLAK